MTNDVVGPIKNLLPFNLDSSRGPYATVEEACQKIPNNLVDGVSYRLGKIVDIGNDTIGYTEYRWIGGDYADNKLVKTQWKINSVETNSVRAFGTEYLPYNKSPNVYGAGGSHSSWWVDKNISITDYTTISKIWLYKTQAASLILGFFTINEAGNYVFIAQRSITNPTAIGWFSANISDIAAIDIVLPIGSKVYIGVKGTVAVNNIGVAASTTETSYAIPAASQSSGVLGAPLAFEIGMFLERSNGAYFGTKPLPQRIGELEASIITETPQSDNLNVSDGILVFKGFKNLIEGVDTGIQSSYVVGRAALSTVTFAANDGTTPPELSTVSKILTAKAVTSGATYNLSFDLTTNRKKWTFGSWLRKSEYIGGALRVHVAWSIAGASAKFGANNVLYADLVLGANGTVFIGGFSAYFEITDVFGDWFYLTVKQVSYDAAFPDHNKIQVLPYKNGGTEVGKAYSFFHPALTLVSTTIEPRTLKYKVTTGRTSMLDLAASLPSSGGGSGATNTVKLVLPKEIETYVGDTLQIFKYNICSAYNPAIYNIQAVSSKVTGTDYAGDDYRRYWQYVTTVAEEFNVTFYCYDNNRILLDSQVVKIKVAAHAGSPASNKNVIFVGDSLTFYNRIPDEFARVLKSTDVQTTLTDALNGNTIIKSPGKGKTNITLVGTQKNNWLGWVGTELHEGYSGWTWNDFITTGSPFYIGGALNFTQYKTNAAIPSIDIMYLGLGWNDIIKSMATDTDTASVISAAKTFLRAVKAQMPATLVYLWTENFPSLMGGEGNHPYGSDVRVDIQTWKSRLTNVYAAYKVIVEDPEFSTFVKLIGANCMFDSENMLQFGLANKNNRLANTEIRGTDDVHPSNGGFFQHADSLIRSFIYNHCQ
jgi:hypothetical protein